MTKLAVVAGATGGSGYHIVSQLLANDYLVHILCRNISKASKMFDHPNVTFI